MKFNAWLGSFWIMWFLIFNSFYIISKTDLKSKNSANLVVNIKQVSNKQNGSSITQSTTIINLKIEILLKSEGRLSIIKSDSISLPNGIWATYNITPEPSSDTVFQSFAIKFRPILLKSADIDQGIQFEVFLFKGKILIKEKTLLVKRGESLILELLEDCKSQTTILFKISHDLFAVSKTLSHTLNIEAKIVPIFAVDDTGHPLYGLKKDDVFLRINGKEVPFQFYQYPDHVSGTAPASSNISSVKDPDANIQPNKRNVFIFNRTFKTGV